MCGEVVTEEADHALNCMTGPVRQAVHAELADILCEFIEEAGAHARREAFVREFRPRQRAAATSRRRQERVDKEAFLDVWGWGSAEVSDLLVDVTWRHPMASRYLPRAAAHAGHACRLAAEEKAVRYPASGGRAAHTFCVEGWGRLGAPGEAVLAFAVGGRGSLRPETRPSRTGQIAAVAGQDRCSTAARHRPCA